MTRLVAAAFVGVALVVPAQRPQHAPSAADLVELDVVALDRHDQPVTDLRREDFTIKEDGRAIELKTFSQVPALELPQFDEGRIVALLMDDIGVPIRVLAVGLDARAAYDRVKVARKGVHARARQRR